jgi:hypothetical protein
MTKDDLRDAVFQTVRRNAPSAPFYVHIGVRTNEAGIRPVRGGPGYFSIFLEGTGGYHPPEGIHAVILDKDHDDESGTSHIKYPRAVPYHLKLNANYVFYGTLKTLAKEVYTDRFESMSGEGAADGITVGWKPGCKEFFITECTTSNLVLVDKSDDLTFIPKEDFLLNGITMQLTEKLVQERFGLKTQRKRVYLSEFRDGIKNGDISVFETGSSAGLTAIRSVDGMPVQKWHRFDELHALYEKIRFAKDEKTQDLIVAVE